MNRIDDSWAEIVFNIGPKEVLGVFIGVDRSIEGGNDILELRFFLD